MPPEPLILGFDTAAAHCAAALVSGSQVIAARQEAMHKGQAERLFPLLQEMLEETGINWRDLAAIGVGIGPGNFTGVRIAVAAARGLALSLGVPALGVTGLEALALGRAGPVLTALDARRDQVYLQTFGYEAAPDPQLCPIAAIRRATHGCEGLTCIGPMAATLAPVLGADMAQPCWPAAAAIALIAASRAALPGQPRPAPLYLRPPDAAPPRAAPPVMLS